MAYATITDVEAGYRTLTEAEQTMCEALLEEAADIIDCYNAEASEQAKMRVSTWIVRRAIGAASESAFPLGVTQGSAAAGGYSQSWTNSNGYGELYLTKVDKRMLGVGNRIGSKSPVEGLVET